MTVPESSLISTVKVGSSLSSVVRAWRMSSSCCWREAEAGAHRALARAAEADSGGLVPDDVIGPEVFDQHEHVKGSTSEYSEPP